MVSRRQQQERAERRACCCPASSLGFYGEVGRREKGSGLTSLRKVGCSLILGGGGWGRGLRWVGEILAWPVKVRKAEEEHKGGGGTKLLSMKRQILGEGTQNLSPTMTVYTSALGMVSSIRPPP